MNITRRSLLTLLAVGPLARFLPTPPPFVPTAVEDVARVFDVPVGMLSKHFIEVTAFGDDRPIWVTRLSR